MLWLIISWLSVLVSGSVIVIDCNFVHLYLVVWVFCFSLYWAYLDVCWYLGRSLSFVFMSCCIIALCLCLVGSGVCVFALLYPSFVPVSCFSFAFTSLLCDCICFYWGFVLVFWFSLVLCLSLVVSFLCVWIGCVLSMCKCLVVFWRCACVGCILVLCLCLVVS